MKQITMKKKVKQLCCILLAVILCMGMTVPAMAASSRYYNAAVSSYKKYVKGKRGSYKIVDIDGKWNSGTAYANSSAGINEIRTYNPKTRKMYVQHLSDMARATIFRSNTPEPVTL